MNFTVRKQIALGKAGLGVFFLLLTSTLTLHTAALYAQTAGAAAAFSRLGVSVRAIGAGNTGVAQIQAGEAEGYYNPAAIAFSNKIHASLSVGLLSQDRRLNFFSFAAKAGPTASLSISLINAGVSDIDSRSIDGTPLGLLNTSENLLMVSFAHQFNERLSVGIMLRGFFASLYTGVPNVFSLGFDFGVIYSLFSEEKERLTLGASVANLNARYRWDTTPLYGLEGTQLTDEIPRLFRAGVNYRRQDVLGLNHVSVLMDAEYVSWPMQERVLISRNENGIPSPRLETLDSHRADVFFKTGVEMGIVEAFRVRVGIDQLSVGETGFWEAARPSAGFTVGFPIKTLSVTLDYAYVLEPFGGGLNMIALGVTF